MAPRSMTTGQAGVIEPILTTHARGYVNAEYIAPLACPIVDIPNRNMRVLRFGKEDFRRVNTRRAPGAGTARIQYGYASDPVSLPQDSLEGVVPSEIMEEAASVPGIDLGTGAVNQVLNQSFLGLECDVAALFRDAGNYLSGQKVTLSGTSLFSDPASDPSKMVDDAGNLVRRRIGRKPNQLTLAPVVFTALSRHPKIMDRFKYTSSDSLTADMLAKYFNLEKVVVGGAIMLADGASDDDMADDIWGNDAILSYVGRDSDYKTPSFAYTYRLKGTPYVEEPYFERNPKSWIYPVTWECRPYITAPDAGFLFKNAAVSSV